MLDGAWLWDLRGGSSRRAGFRGSGGWNFDAERGAMLYARIIGEDLIVSDWNYVSRFDLDLEGEALGIEAPRAI